ncbi:MAG TPA: PIN domain-containing protein [Thermoanaerobaculia bacterium]|nr:PIN domain-containing protein [Thermoanaerobaculia bacterium]
MTSRRFLLDTSALLAHYRREPGWARVQAWLEESGIEILAASVSLPEFARRLRDLGATVEEARQTVEDYMELLDDLVAIDEAVAFAAFEIGCETAERIPLIDALIAAAAREREACLVHRDRHMSPIPSSVVEQLDLAKEPDVPKKGP